ncbi:MAG: hypothetical protein GYA24_19130 [Candidatus Lokiarchaeota archaeon]|nr:hypothetical protein [Candidatus Lokiarchaeota archaeon]
MSLVEDIMPSMMGFSNSVDGNSMAWVSRNDLVQFKIVENQGRSDLEHTTIECITDGSTRGRVWLFTTRNGTETIVEVDGMAWTVAVSYHSSLPREVDIFTLPGPHVPPPREPMHAGRLHAVQGSLARWYEFEERGKQDSCKVILDGASVMRYLFVTRSRIIGFIHVKPMGLDVWIKGKKVDKDTCVKLGIAFSIWRLMPCS